MCKEQNSKNKMAFFSELVGGANYSNNSRKQRKNEKRKWKKEGVIERDALDKARSSCVC